MGRPHENWTTKKNWARRLAGKLRDVNPVKLAAGLFAILMVLCAGTFAGVPREKARAPRYGAASIRRWATTVFWCSGIRPLRRSDRGGHFSAAGQRDGIGCGGTAGRSTALHYRAKTEQREIPLRAGRIARFW